MAAGVYRALGERGSRIEDVEEDVIVSTIPVAASLGFAGSLRGETRGRAFAQLAFAGWQLVDGDVCALEDEGGAAAAVLMEICARKGLPQLPPVAADWIDRL